jgi:DNA polymerase III, alpha chain, Gram-positive type
MKRFEKFLADLDPEYLDGKMERCQANPERTHIRLTVSYEKPVDLGLLEYHLSRMLNAQVEIVSANVQPQIQPEVSQTQASGTQPQTEFYTYEGSKVIVGKKIMSGTQAIKSITDHSEVVVWGEVFAKEARTIKDGKWTIHLISIADNSGSVTLKKFCAADSPQSKKFDGVKKGQCILASGKVQYDTYSKELQIDPRDITLVTRKLRSDDAEEKRIELHCHTNMSAKDGMCPAEKLVETAARYGHKAIAITDHGVLQAFPDAMNACFKVRKKDPDFKVIYGVESYFIRDNSVNAVFGLGANQQYPLSGTFVVFDVETTGLSAISERLTEIGASKIKDGKVIDSFSTYVNPERPIPPKITELTGITDATVKDAPTEAAAAKSFMDFAGDAPVIAHNASFDMSFITAACERAEIAPPAVYIDTVAIARVLYPDIRNHKLNTLAEHLRCGGFNHHRAVDDSNVLVKIFENMLAVLYENGIRDLSELNVKLASIGVDPRKLPSYHQIIFAKNKTGLKNLYKLVSTGHIDNFYKKPLTFKSDLDKHREGLVIGSACEQGELFRAVMRGDSPEAIDKIAELYDYFEIQPTGNNEFLIRKGEVADRAELIEINKKIVRLGERLDKPVVATCDVHFLNPEDALYREIIMSGIGFDDAGEQAPLYLHTTDEMLAEFSYLGEKKAKEVVIDNPAKIADMCEYLEPVPQGKLYTPTIPGAEKELEELSNRTAREMYGETLPAVVKARLDKELTAIIKHGYAVLYVIAHKIIKESNNNGYHVGSRGSVGSSFVATMSGISEVNPLPPHRLCPKCKHSIFKDSPDADDELKNAGSGYDVADMSCPKCGENMIGDGHDIPFETFLGFKGDKVPDIDLNFSNENQHAAHEYTKTLFGDEYVFRAGTISTIASQMAFGYVKHYLEDRGEENVPRAQIDRLVAGCTGIKNTTGQHAGGMIVVPKEFDIYDFTPIQRPADKDDTDVITTHFDFHCLHDTILKLDLLGHDVPTLYKHLEDITDVKIGDVPTNDARVMSLFTSPDAMGIDAGKLHAQTGTLTLPEVSTRYVQQMLVDCNPQKFSDLLQISGLSHGTDVWIGNAAELIKSGECTIESVIGTRDNIMVYLIEKGLDPALAFKITEITRKGKAAKELTNDMVMLMQAHDVPLWYIDSCKKIKYMFPKAHAAAYVTSAVKLGWFKLNYPLEYYSVYFTIKGQDFEAETAMAGQAAVERRLFQIENDKEATKKDNDAYDMLLVINEYLLRGFKFLPIDIEKSHPSEFLVEKSASEAGTAIRLPFNSIKGVGATAAAALQAAAQKGFRSVEDLASTPGVGRSVCDMLEAAGAFKDIPKTNQISFF